MRLTHSHILTETTKGLNDDLGSWLAFKKSYGLVLVDNPVPSLI